jgi:mono/diheme cytochrome c family protein
MRRQIAHPARASLRSQRARPADTLKIALKRALTMKSYRMGSQAAVLLVAMPVMLGFTERPLVHDAAAGERLAVRWCSSCHLIQPTQAQANADVPSFSAIARMPHFNPDDVATFLLTSHPKMPSYSLSRIEARAIASYIESLAEPVR